MTADTRLLFDAVLVSAAGGMLIVLVVSRLLRGRYRPPGAFATLVASNDELARRVRALERGREQDHLALLRLQTRLEIQTTYSRALADYSRMLADRLRALGQTDIPPIPSPPVIVDVPPVSTPDNRALAQILSALFSRDELDELAFQLNINAEEIGGETRGKRARALVEFAARHGMLDELIELARRLRPEGEI